MEIPTLCINKKKYWSFVVDNEYVGKPLSLSKNEKSISGNFCAWFLAPTIAYCLMIDDFGVISAEGTFKGDSEEHRMIKLNE